MENNNINTIKDLVSYLQTLDQNKPIVGEYIKIIANQYIGIEERPLFKSLIKKDNDHYKLTAMFY